MLVSKKHFDEWMEVLLEGLKRNTRKVDRLILENPDRAYDSFDIYTCEDCGVKTRPIVTPQRINQFGGTQFVLACPKCGSRHLKREEL